MHIWCAPTWRFHTELCKFLRNISTNICGLGERTDLKLGEVSSLFIFNKITISWLYPLNGFQFIFLLGDSENDLLSRVQRQNYHVQKFSQVERSLLRSHTVTLFFLILSILGSWIQMVELSFHFSLNFSSLKSQMTDELNFHKWIHNTHSTFFCREFYPIDFSCWGGDLGFKLVASSKILVTMATKMVATWRVGRTIYSMLAVTLWTEQWRIDLYKTLKAMVTTQISGVIRMRTMFLLSRLKRCMFPMRTL